MAEVKADDKADAEIKSAAAVAKAAAESVYWARFAELAATIEKTAAMEKEKSDAALKEYAEAVIGLSNAKNA